MLENQAHIFIYTIVVGAILGLIFDFFRIMRRKGNTKDVLVYIQDIIFWLIVTVVIIVTTFLINNGELRGYMIFGYILGGIFYILLFSKVIRKIFSSIFDFIENVFSILLKKIKEFIIINKKTQKNDKKIKN